MMQALSIRRYAVWLGLTRRHRKLACSLIHLAPYRIQRVVRGEWFGGDAFVGCFFLFRFLPLVDPKRSNTHAVIHHRSHHLHYPHSHIRKLLTLLSVFSPQSRNELKRAVDDCAPLGTDDRVSKKEKLETYEV